MKDNNTKRLSVISPLFVMAAGILWGCMGLLVRTMQPYGYTSMEIVLFRAVVTGVMMLIFTGIFRRGELRIKPKDIWCFLFPRKNDCPRDHRDGACAWELRVGKPAETQGCGGGNCLKPMLGFTLTSGLKWSNIMV